MATEIVGSIVTKIQISFLPESTIAMMVWKMIRTQIVMVEVGVSEEEKIVRRKKSSTSLIMTLKSF